jgi:hypothetical protein
MDEPSPTARDVLAAYRRRRVMHDDAHARVRARLLESIESGEHGDNAAAARRETWRRVAIASVFALAAAAAIVLLVRGLRSDSALPAAHDERGQAPYEHGTDAPELPLDTRARDDASSSAPAPPATEVTPSEAALPVRRAARTEPAASTAVSTLAEELAIVRRIHAALDREDATAALAAIAEHERRFASGQLVEERKSLRVEALCRAGKAAQARAEAQVFLREHAGSAHADRVRSACPKP